MDIQGKSKIITVEPELAPEPPSDTKRIARLGLWTLGVGFGGFLLWAAFAPLDEGVPTVAQVSVDTKRKPVQHLAGGTVREVLVREGQLVQQGDVLLRIGDKVARANHEASRQRYYGLRAAQNRLQAEQAGAGSISFAQDLIAAAADDPLVRQHMDTQRQLFGSRRVALASAISSMEEAVRGYEAQIEGYGQLLTNRQEQLRLLEREVAGVRSLVAEGYAPMTKQMELERSMAEVRGSIADITANQMRARSSILELRQRMQTQRAEYRKEVESQLAEVQREVEAEEVRLRAVEDELVRTEITAPASGQVVGLAVQSAGAVIGPGQKIMDIVPRDEGLMLDAQVAPHLIDRVRNGQPVDVRFSAFAHSPQLVVEGTVQSLSGDILVDEVTHAAFYLARVAITPEGLKTLGSRQLQPGMQAEVVIRTGERSLLTYLLHPLTKRMAASMKEE
jgi:protease secretion system membrane fusion protein